jgi:hypothetical protein
MALVNIPPLDGLDMELHLNNTLKEALSYGVTQVTDAAVLPHTLEFLKKFVFPVISLYILNASV